jgi:hypothetical protein
MNFRRVVTIFALVSATAYASTETSENKKSLTTEENAIAAVASSGNQDTGNVDLQNVEQQEDASTDAAEKLILLKRALLKKLIIENRDKTEDEFIEALVATTWISNEEAKSFFNNRNENDEYIDCDIAEFLFSDNHRAKFNMDWFKRNKLGSNLSSEELEPRQASTIKNAKTEISNKNLYIGIGIVALGVLAVGVLVYMLVLNLNYIPSTSIKKKKIKRMSYSNNDDMQINGGKLNIRLNKK